MAFAGIMMIVSVFYIITITTGSALEEELPTKASSVDLLELLFGADDENTAIPFLTNDFHSSSTRLQWIDHADLGFLPYGEEIDRAICENNTDLVERQWYTYENLEYSETLRCYNHTYRWCFVNDLPPEVLEIDDSYYGDLSSCAFPFYDHNDVLYSSAGQRMPKAFNSRCSDRLEWGLWFTIIPLTGCGIDENRYRFCDSQGNIDWDMVNGVGPFNCREFNAIDVFRTDNSDDEWGMEELCVDQTNGCADNAQLGCKDGKYDPTLRFEAGAKNRCSSYVNVVDYNLVWAGQKTNEGLDLACLPYKDDAKK